MNQPNISFGVYKPSNLAIVEDEPQVLDAYFAIRKIEENNKVKNISFIPITEANIGDELCVVVKTTGLYGHSIKINVRQGQERLLTTIDSPLSLIQANEEKVLFKACVGELSDSKVYSNASEFKNFAVTPLIKFQNKDDEITKKWNKLLREKSDKKTFLYLLVEADTKGKVGYHGKNRDGTDDAERRFGNIEGKWLELKARSPIIVIDPGHGDRNSENKMYDPGTVSGTEYEKDYALQLSKALRDGLISDDYRVFMTREDDIDVRPKKAVNWRYEFANEKAGEILISVHLDYGSKEEVFAIYQQGKSNEKESISLAKKIMKEVKSIATVPKNSIRAVKDATNFNTLGVLNKFAGKAAILIEFGGIASDSNQNNIKTNSRKIGEAIQRGLENYVYE